MWGDNSPYTVPAHVIPPSTDEMWNNRMRSNRKVLTLLRLLLVEGSLSVIVALYSLKNNGSARLYLVFMEGCYKFISTSLERLLLYYISGFIDTCSTSLLDSHRSLFIIISSYGYVRGYYDTFYLFIIASSYRFLCV